MSISPPRSPSPEPSTSNNASSTNQAALTTTTTIATATIATASTSNVNIFSSSALEIEALNPRVLETLGQYLLSLEPTLDSPDLLTNMRAYLSRVSSAVLQQQSHRDVTYVSKEGAYTHFLLNQFPEFICKTPNHTHHRFAYSNSFVLVKAKLDEAEVIRQEILTGHYPNLYLPKNRLCASSGHTLVCIVEEKLTTLTPAMISSIWQKNEQALIPAVKELTRLIITTGLPFYHPKRCIPIYREGCWKLALTNIAILRPDLIKDFLCNLLNSLTLLECQEAVQEVCRAHNVCLE